MNGIEIPVNRPLFDGNEKAYLAECIESGWVGDGLFVHRFEQEFAKYAGRKHGIAVSSGTAALDVSVAALGLGTGDEVILPALTIVSCVHQIVRAGACPVLVDCDPITWNMSVDHIERRITGRTRAIMMVHLYGLPVDIDPILSLAKKHGLQVIEDAAQMHGQTYKGKRCGSFGDLSTFSFYANKTITTGEGGMVLTDDDILADRCRHLRDLCHTKRFVHDRLGWNYRMSNLQAAVGCAQLERIESHVTRKREIGARYNALLEDTSVRLPLELTSYAENIYWAYTIEIETEPLADVMMKELAQRGIATRSFFCPLNKQPALQPYFLGQRMPHAEYAYRYGLYLPSGVGTTDEEIERVCEAVKEVLA